MKLPVFLSFAAGLVVATSIWAAEETTDENLKKLEGTWTLVSGESDGKPLSDEIVKNSKLIIKGNTHTVKIGNDTKKGTHSVNAKKSPMEMDAVDSEGSSKGKNLGIYELKGDEQRICFAPAGKDRPKAFTTKAGTGHFMHVWRRQK